MSRLISAVIFCLMLSGCATIGTRSLQDLPAEWPPLGTTKDEVRDRLGSPSSQSVILHDNQQREVWGWNYGTAELNPLLWVPVVGLFVAASDEAYRVEGKDLTVTFNSDGRVVGRSISNQKHGAYQPYE
jgi:outer membrane protein assembly factor BamE (lipoprotein component of BamABCDE complex)